MIGVRVPEEHSEEKEKAHLDDTLIRTMLDARMIVNQEVV